MKIYRISIKIYVVNWMEYVILLSVLCLPIQTEQEILTRVLCVSVWSKRVKLTNV
uniref:Uncharacterized protein n=1 Tax=Solanum lycopersicum TaxID=4081 RepID=A0A3Q7J992_SOLLC